MKKLYLNRTKDVFLQKLEDVVYFVSDVEDWSEAVNREDIPFLSRGFGISVKELEDFFDSE